jgi:flagellar FliL protein
MADDDIDEDEDKTEGGEDEGKSSGGGSKKLIIIIVAVILLIIGGGAAAFFMGLFDSSDSGSQATEAEPSSDSKKAASELAFFHDLPDITVNLNSKGRKRSVMKLKISLEVASPDEIPKLQALMPRVIDNFQVYLRELRLDDLKGSAGMYRLREELLMRVNAAITPAKVKAVLFKEMLVQ